MYGCSLPGEAALVWHASLHLSVHSCPRMYIDLSALRQSVPPEDMAFMLHLQLCDHSWTIGRRVGPYNVSLAERSASALLRSPPVSATPKASAVCRQQTASRKHL